MINSGAIDNFMARALVEREEYSTRKKSNAYNLMIVNRNPLFNKNERVNTKTRSLLIAI